MLTKISTWNCIVEFHFDFLPSKKNHKPLTQESELFAFSNIWVYIFSKWLLGGSSLQQNWSMASTQDHEIVQGCYSILFRKPEARSCRTSQSDVCLFFQPCFELQPFAAMRCNSQSTHNQGCFSAASKSSSKPAHQQMGLMTWCAETPAVTICFVPTDYYISDHAHGWQKIYSKWLVLMNVSYS